MVKPIPKLKYSQRGVSAQRSIWRPWILSRGGDVMSRVFDDDNAPASQPKAKTKSNSIVIKITDKHRFTDSETDNLSDTKNESDIASNET